MSSSGDENEAATPEHPWASRIVENIKYCRYSGVDSGGRPSIFFKIEYSPGHEKVKVDITKHLNSFKRLNGNETNFKLRKDRIHGWAWRLPDTFFGRQVADIIDNSLGDFAEKIDREQGR